MGLFDRLMPALKPLPIEIPSALRTMDLEGRLGWIYSEIEKIIAPGMTTLQIEERVVEALQATGDIGYFKGYRGYPAYLGASVNDEVVHAPPSSRKLEPGDLLKLEFGITDRKRHAFVGWTYPVGRVSADAERLMAAGKRALDCGVREAKPGARIVATSAAIEKSLKMAGYDPNRQYVGYRIGEQAHMSPQIPCYTPAEGDDQGTFQAGMTYAILVIAHEGTSECKTRSDRWTVVSRNRRRSVLYSQIVEPTPTGPRLRTKLRPF